MNKSSPCVIGQFLLLKHLVYSDWSVARYLVPYWRRPSSDFSDWLIFFLTNKNALEYFHKCLSTQIQCQLAR